MLFLESAGAILHSPECSDYHWCHCCLHFPHLFNFFHQPLVFLKLLVFLLDVAVTWNCYSIITAFLCSLSTTTMPGSLAITWLSVCICKSHRILALSFSTAFGGFWFWDFQSIVSTNAPVHYSRRLVMEYHVCRKCQHLTPHYYVLDCLSSLFAQPAPEVLSDVDSPSLVYNLRVLDLGTNPPCKELFCLYISGFNLLLWPDYYANGASDD